MFGERFRNRIESVAVFFPSFFFTFDSGVLSILLSGGLCFVSVLLSFGFFYMIRQRIASNPPAHHMNTNEPKKYRVTLTYRSIITEHVWATNKEAAYRMAIAQRTEDIGDVAELLESEIDEMND